MAGSRCGGAVPLTSRPTGPLAPLVLVHPSCHPPARANENCRDALQCCPAQGLPRREVRRQAGELLDAVKLSAAARQRTSAYSGGMRRRLRQDAGWRRCGEGMCASCCLGRSSGCCGATAQRSALGRRLALAGCFSEAPPASCCRSVAIALLGDPLVVYLDEPTTGEGLGGQKRSSMLAAVHPAPAAEVCRALPPLLPDRHGSHQPPPRVGHHR
jgi:hypothetical protein